MEATGSQNKSLSSAKCMCRGDAFVCALLGEQQKPAEGKRIRPSTFAFRMEVDGGVLLFHTLTRMLLLLDSGAAAAPGAELSAMLYAHHFLVPEDTEESRLYLEVKNILALREERPAGLTHCVILPTSGCNARCFYCYEQGMVRRKMSSETAEDTVHFLLSHIAGPKLHIHWFGGEPLCAPDNIDRICASLAAAGVDFTAEMTSNGSLFTEDVVQKAVEAWKVTSVQVTLDGMAEEYARRKCYTDLTDPFAAVIRNMHRLLAAGISLAVRLNTDRDNLADIYRVADFLRAEFSAEERRRMQVYAHVLFGVSGNLPEDCPAGAAEDPAAEVNEYLCRIGLMDPNAWRQQFFTLRSRACRAAAPEHSLLIGADGRLFACEAMTEEMSFGDVRRGIDPEAFARVSSPCALREDCAACAFLPLCTEFSRCPHRPAAGDCVRLEKQKLERELRFAYTLIREQQGRDAAQPAEHPENVPD